MLNSFLSATRLTSDRGPMLYAAIVEGREADAMAILNSFLCPKWDDIRPQNDEPCENLLVKASAFPELLRAIIAQYNPTVHIENAIMATIVQSKPESLEILLNFSEEHMWSHAFDIAVNSHYTDSIRVFLEHPNTIVREYSIRAYLQRWSLKSFVEDRNIDGVRLLLENFNTHISRAEKSLALDFAVDNDDAESLRLILKHCITDIVASNKGLLLRTAAQNGRSNCLRVLLEHCNTDIDNDFKNMGFKEAAENGHFDCLQLLLEHCNTNIDTIVKGLALKHAAKHGHINCVQFLLENCPDIDRYNKGLSLGVAAANNHANIVTLLLAHGAGSNPLDVSYAISKAITHNSVESTEILLAHPSTNALTPYRSYRILSDLVATVMHLDTLNRLLNTPVFMAGASDRRNQLLAEIQALMLDPAEIARLQPIYDRFMQIPAIDQDTHLPVGEFHELATQANFAEGAMMALSSSQLALVAELRRHYGADFDEAGWDTLLAQILSYLESEYTKNPAIDEHGNPLPLDFTTGLSQASLRSYYQHPIHAAWRYLSRPNPWLAPNARWTSTIAENARAANIDDEGKALLGYIWLAISDENVKLDDGFSIEKNKRLLAKVVARAGRGHNWDNKRAIRDNEGNLVLQDGKIQEEFYDDLEGDKPTCQWGVKQTLLNGYYGHPYFSSPESRALSPDIMRDFMITHLINRKGKATDPDNLIDRLDKLSITELNNIFNELKNMFLNMFDDENTKNEKYHHAALVTTPEQISNFIERCRKYFGSSRINDETSIKFLNETYYGYMALVRHSLENPLLGFSTHLYDHFNSTLAPTSEPSCSSSSSSVSSSSSSSASSSSAFDSSPTFIRSNIRRTTREDDNLESTSETKRQRTADGSVPESSNDDSCVIGTSTRRDTSDRDEPVEGTRATKRARQ